jgi:hypothetical protein
MDMLNQRRVGQSYHFTSCLLQVITAGPYTRTDNLLFEPLQELLSYACRKQPQLLILVSPLNFMGQQIDV